MPDVDAARKTRVRPALAHEPGPEPRLDEGDQPIDHHRDQDRGEEEAALPDLPIGGEGADGVGNAGDQRIDADQHEERKAEAVGAGPTGGRGGSVESGGGHVDLSNRNATFRSY